VQGTEPLKERRGTSARNDT